jgi:AcrR family transcriptional regulator
MNALAREVSYSPASLYEYFASKEAIIEAVRRQGLQRLEKHLQLAANSECPFESLYDIASAYIAFAVQNPDYFQFVSTADARTGELGGTTHSLLLMVIMQAIEHGVQTASIRLPQGSGADEMAYAVCSLVHGFAILRLTDLRHASFDFSRTERQMLAALCEPFRAGKVKTHPVELKGKRAMEASLRPVTHEW